MAKPLTTQQRALSACLVASGGDVGGAWKGAGYSSRKLALKASRLPVVVAEVERLTAALLERAGINANRVIEELAHGAYIDPRVFFGPKGETVLPPGQWPESAARAVASFDVYEKKVPTSITVEGGKSVQKWETERTYKVKLVDKTAHLQLAMRHLKMLNDKLTVEHEMKLEDLIGGSMRKAHAPTDAPPADPTPPGVSDAAPLTSLPPLRPQ
jgi:phage terminase small subunit